MRLVLSIIVLLCSINAPGQTNSELLGDFGFSQSWYYHFKLSLRDSGNFILTISSDIGSSKTLGKWTVKSGALNLVPVQYFRYDRQRKEWRKDNAVNNAFRYGQIKIITKDRLFSDSNEEHIHINRLPAPEDGPYSIAFPYQKFRVADSMDSIKLTKILERLSSWPFDYPFRIELTPQTSKDDANVDNYIGLKRCREIMNYLAKRLDIGTAGFSIKDTDTFDNSGYSQVKVQIIHKYERHEP